MGIVHHSNHPRYLERGRVEMLRLAGLDYLTLTQQGNHFPVLELQIKYRRGINFDDIIAIETEVAELSKTRLAFSYRVFRVNELKAGALFESPLKGELLCSGETHHCCVNEKGRPMEMTPAMFEKLHLLFTGANP